VRPATDCITKQTPFTDVPAGSWFAPYVSWAVSNGLASGTSPTTFGAGNPVSRQDFAVLMHRFATHLGVDTGVPSGFALSFPDAGSVGSWAQEPLRWAVHVGLITGTGQMLAPAGTADRAQSATILWRFTDLTE